MYGISTRASGDVAATDADLAFFTVKRVTGETVRPRDDAVNSLSCFGDQSMTALAPDRLAVDDDGVPATADRPTLDWPVVCPTDDRYRRTLRALVDRCTDASEDLRLTTVGLPGADWCRCDRCQRRFADSDHGSWASWRAAMLTDFVTGVADAVPGDLYLTVHPNPTPAALRERTGLDLTVLDDVVDAFVVPLCDPRYETSYWLESIASGFASVLDSPFVAQLLATEANRERLPAVTARVEPYAEHVVYGGDPDVVRWAVGNGSPRPSERETERPPV